MRTTSRKSTPTAAALAAAVAMTGALLSAGAAASTVEEHQAARAATEPTFSVFVYERLGATPSIRMRKRDSAPPTASERRRPDAGPFGAFTYDAVGATPSVQIKRAPVDTADRNTRSE